MIFCTKKLIHSNNERYIMYLSKKVINASYSDYLVLFSYDGS